eukprot:TRINITY_DN1821_c0_g1_i4.p1 TRINITY_DN1821_c0_g1~~TRINITY_DN1821_c0_g1_i4.p1  ORF type:complete len:241 (-),score=60.60 TRINITY_DN1821_c0_g1_i4:476-1093(-)
MSSGALPKPLGDHALIIGAGSGLGLELAKVLAPTGTALAVTVRNTVDPALEELDASIIRGIDVAKDGPEKLVEALAALGWVNVSTLVCVAGILTPDALGDLKPDSWRQMMDVCALGPLRIVDALVTAGLLTAGSKVGLVTSEGGSIGLRTPKEGAATMGTTAARRRRIWLARSSRWTLRSGDAAGVHPSGLYEVLNDRAVFGQVR